MLKLIFPLSKIRDIDGVINGLWLDLLWHMKTIKSAFFLKALDDSTQLGLAAKPAALQADYREGKLGWIFSFFFFLNWDYTNTAGGIET